MLIEKMERLLKELSNRTVNVTIWAGVFFPLWSYSQSFDLKKNEANGINYYQINYFEKDKIIDSVFVSGFFNQSIEKLQFIKNGTDEIILIFETDGTNRNTRLTLNMVRFVYAENRIVKQSEFKISKYYNKLDKYDFQIKENTLYVHNQEGIFIKKYPLKDYPNLEDLASDITSNL